MIGRVISGRYVVEAVVGTGGMAVVYRAFDLRSHQTVALKVLREEGMLRAHSVETVDFDTTDSLDVAFDDNALVLIEIE